MRAQDIDTLKSEHVYTMLKSCDYRKTIIDGRNSAKFYSGHIKNAVYIDAFSENVHNFLANYIDRDTLVIYCTNRTRSEKIIDELIKLDYQGKIIFMQDGINEWKNHNFPVIINKRE